MGRKSHMQIHQDSWPPLFLTHSSGIQGTNLLLTQETVKGCEEERSHNVEINPLADP